MLVTTFLFKIEYRVPNLINSHSINRQYSYEIADFIQLTSCEYQDWIEYGDTDR